MRVIDTKFNGLKIIQQKKHGDERGNLRETFNKKTIKWDELVFDYATTSKKNVENYCLLLILHPELK